MYVSDFEKRIKQLREEKGLSQKQLADRLHVTRAAVNSWEMGGSMPTIDKILAISRIFHVSTDYLLGNDMHEVIDVSPLGFEEKQLIQHMIYYMEAIKSNKNPKDK